MSFATSSDGIKAHDFALGARGVSQDGPHAKVLPNVVWQLAG
jgi:hypothetical protein